MYQFFKRRRQQGQSLVEYGLIVVLISVASIGALQGLQGGIDGALGAASGALTQACEGPDCTTEGEDGPPPG